MTWEDGNDMEHTFQEIQRMLVPACRTSSNSNKGQVLITTPCEETTGADDSSEDEIDIMSGCDEGEEAHKDEVYEKVEVGSKLCSVEDVNDDEVELGSESLEIICEECETVCTEDNEEDETGMLYCRACWKSWEKDLTEYERVKLWKRRKKNFQNGCNK